MSWFNDLIPNLIAEGIGIVITVFVIDIIIKKSEKRKVELKIKPLKKYVYEAFLYSYWFIHNLLQRLKESVNDENIKRSESLLTDILERVNTLNIKLNDNLDMLNMEERLHFINIRDLMRVLCENIEFGLKNFDESMIIQDINFNTNKIIKEMKKCYNSYTEIFENKSEMITYLYEGEVKIF